MANAAERLAREIKELRRRLEGLERSAAADLRSIDGGAQVVYDDDGIEVVRIGAQGDGSLGVQGVNGGSVLADEARDLAIGGSALDTGAVGVEKMTASPTSGILSNTVPDPFLTDPEYRALREARDLDPDWSIVPVENLFSPASVDWTPNTAVVNTATFDVIEGQEYEAALNVVMDLAGLTDDEEIVRSNLFPVSESRDYSVLLQGDTADDPALNGKDVFAYYVDWYDSASALISSTPYALPGTTPDVFTSPVGAVEAQVRITGRSDLSAEVASYTGPATIVGASSWEGNDYVKVGHYFATYTASATSTGASAAWLAKDIPATGGAPFFVRVTARAHEGVSEGNLRLVLWYELGGGRGVGQYATLVMNGNVEWNRYSTWFTTPHGCQRVWIGVANDAPVAGESADVTNVELMPRGDTSEDGFTYAALIDPIRFQWRAPEAEITAAVESNNERVTLRARDRGGTAETTVEVRPDGLLLDGANLGADLVDHDSRISALEGAPPIYDAGVTTVQFDGTGTGTIAHGLGVVPRGVSMTQASNPNNNLTFKLQGRSATEVTLLCTNIVTNNDVANATRDVSWAVFR